ncbi:hypothetical protein [Nocardia brasiliensis]|uniref:hypothetical protein n=1 Tax=Nocardia brasiliensis TaxID=37326 RepID=UPI00245852B9|nr:hypothetical protein [Nocardia brasiliensis]
MTETVTAFVVSPDPFRDPRLSWKAKGVFAFLATSNPDAELSTETITAAGNLGVTGVGSALRELEQCGYLMRQRKRVAGRIVGTSWEYTDTPHGGKAQASGYAAG